jgi:ribonuclease D
MSWTLIESSDALDSLLSGNRHHAMVAIDTEFRRRDTFFPQVALLQVCWGDEPYLIDPLQLDDLSALRAFLTDPSQTKLIHSASEDLEVFSHWLGVLPAPLFDTQRGAALLGLGAGQSYRALVAHFFDVDLPKDETQSDWLQRPLTDAQAQYAAQDVTYLHPMGVQLQNRAMELNRLDWVLEESARLRPGGKPPIAKFKTAYRLPPEQQRVLAEVVDWREGEARHRDRPRSWILNDKIVTGVARSVPRSVRELAAVEDMPQGTRATSRG